MRRGDGRDSVREESILEELEGKVLEREKLEIGDQKLYQGFTLRWEERGGGEGVDNGEKRCDSVYQGGWK